MRPRRNAAQTREGLLQFETEQVRARLTEIDELLRSSRLLLDQARDRRGELSATAAKLQSDCAIHVGNLLERTGDRARGSDGRYDIDSR